MYRRFVKVQQKASLRRGLKNDLRCVAGVRKGTKSAPLGRGLKVRYGSRAGARVVLQQRDPPLRKGLKALNSPDPYWALQQECPVRRGLKAVGVNYHRPYHKLTKSDPIRRGLKGKNSVFIDTTSASLVAEPILCQRLRLVIYSFGRCPPTR